MKEALMGLIFMRTNKDLNLVIAIRLKICVMKSLKRYVIPLSQQIVVICLLSVCPEMSKGLEEF
jgi:hypothetical protein